MSFPDLVPVIEYFQGGSVAFRVKNVGSGAVLEPFSVIVRAGQTGPLEVISVSQTLQPGRETTLLIRRLVNQELKSATITVDREPFRAGGVIRESNEDNNSIFVRKDSLESGTGSTLPVSKNPFDGDSRNNIIRGTDSNNVIRGFDGNDIIWANWGNDNLDGGSGNDALYGQGGADTIVGGSGNDYLDGGTEDNARDVLWGGWGNDRLEGFGGNDALYGQGGADTIVGGNGNDYLDGGTEDDARDILHGQAGNDRLVGLGGNDLLYGGNGDDILAGGAGNDRLEGGQGADIFVLGLGLGRDNIMDFEIGADRIGLDGSLSFGQLSVTQSGQNTEIASGGELLAILMNVSSLNLSSSSFVDNFVIS